MLSLRIQTVQATNIPLKGTSCLGLGKQKRTFRPSFADIMTMLYLLINNLDPQSLADSFILVFLVVKWDHVLYIVRISSDMQKLYVHVEESAYTKMRARFS